MTFFCYLVDIESISAALHEAGLRHQLARPPPLNPVLTLREEQGPGQLICCFVSCSLVFLPFIRRKLWVSPEFSALQTRTFDLIKILAV